MRTLLIRMTGCALHVYVFFVLLVDIRIAHLVYYAYCAYDSCCLTYTCVRSEHVQRTHQQREREREREREEGRRAWGGEEEAGGRSATKYGVGNGEGKKKRRLSIGRSNHVIVIRDG